jgi:hypothetical protein
MLCIHPRRTSVSAGPRAQHVEAMVSFSGSIDEAEIHPATTVSVKMAAEAVINCSK